MYLKECESGYDKDTYPLMLIATLFTVAKLWKQPRGPMYCDEWIRKCDINIQLNFI
jgi:hypothetical protein